MKKPPRVIKLILQAVCILLNVSPIRKRAKDGVGYKDSYWMAALSKDVLGNPRLPDILVEYDRNKLTTDIMLMIEQVV
jgi:dynein heavy chain